MNTIRLSKPVVVVFLLIAVLNVWYFYGGRSKKAVRPFPGVHVVGLDYNLGSQDKTLDSKGVKYVLILPHKLEQGFGLRGVDALSPRDRKSVMQLVDFLESDAEFDGATGCRPSNARKDGDEEKPLSKQESKLSLQKTACRFSVHMWTVVIRNTGPIVVQENSDVLVQVCNFAQGAFLLRKPVFQSLRWNHEYGKLAAMDFFLRSKGKLRIAKLSDSVISRVLSRQDRGMYEGYSGRMFKDYGKLGMDHKILRIVRPKRVEWTKCAPLSSRSPLCPAMSPFSQFNAPRDPFMPICCSSMLSKMLQAVAQAMLSARVEFRVVYNLQMETKSGSKILVLNKPDLDLAVSKKDNDNSTVHRILQQLLGPKYYVGEKMHTRLPISRIVPHFMPSIRVNTSRVFTGDEDMVGKPLFENRIIREMKKLLPVTGDLKERGYIELLPSPRQYFQDSSAVLISGRKYKAYKTS